jgi:methionine-R-sulfoxide reductase
MLKHNSATFNRYRNMMKQKQSSLFKPSQWRDALLLLLLGAVLLGFPLISAMAEDFSKPDKEQLKQMLTPLQYAVTQKDKTEPPYRNPFWNEKAPGIYVDVVSGEALFSSLDKYDSGTGWPSFTRPLEARSIVERDDWKLFVKRIEVRSKLADSHLGHVFDDGPAPTGLRYCVNSAALRFVPLADMESQGYGKYLPAFEKAGFNL